MSAPSTIAHEVLIDPCTRYWVREQFAVACRRDPLDALADAELLVALLFQHWQAVSGARVDDHQLPLVDVRPAAS